MDGKSDPNEIIPAAIVALSAFLCMFALCMFGENLAGQFNALDDALSQCKWYLFPIDVKRMLITLMSNTQQTVALLGYGNIECTRDTFKNVRIPYGFCLIATVDILFKFFKLIEISTILQITQKIFSYFMALRRIAE